VAAAKAALRRRLLAARRERPSDRRTTAAEAVSAALVQGLTGAGPVAAHVPDELEPGFGRLPADLGRLGVPVLMPVVPPEGHDLSWAVDSGRMTPGRFGLLEPLGPRLDGTALATVAVIVVPALAVARDGVRPCEGAGEVDDEDAVEWSAHGDSVRSQPVGRTRNDRRRSSATPHRPSTALRRVTRAAPASLPRA
jgi:5-formyltetrahydrofolate cyclo-ligase